MNPIENENFQNNPTPPPPPQSYYRPRRSNGLSAAALILGILAISSSFLGLGGLIFGGMGIIIAILSRGTEPMDSQAKLGIGLSIVGMILTVVIFSFTVRSVLTPDLQQEMQEYYNDYYEDSL